MPFRIAAGLLGVFFLLQGLQWLVVPASSAEALGMTLLEGAGRSTQIGDTSSFFLCSGAFALYGAIAQNPSFIRAAAILIGLVSITRTIAWAFHGAAFTSAFITIEVLVGVTLLFVASRISTPTAH